MTTARKQKTFSLAVLSAAVFFVAAPAQACYTARVENQSTKDIYTVWSAMGCAGAYHWELLVCGHKIIKPGETKSYNYNWGVTEPSVYLFQTVTDADKAEATVNYAFDKHGFKLENGDREYVGNPKGCGGDYSITFTESLRKKWLGD